MLVDIFIAPSAPFQAPKMEPVVPNLMSGSAGSSPAKAGEVATAKAAVEARKWRRLSMAFPFLFWESLYPGAGQRNAVCAATPIRRALFLRQETGDAARRAGVEHAVIAQCDALAGFGVGHKGEDLTGLGAADGGALLA